MPNNRSIAFGLFESNRIGCGRRRWLRRRCRQICAGEPNAVFAVRAGGDQQRGDDKDPYGQRDGNDDDGRFHLGPMARCATAQREGTSEDVQVI
jgi:hypothetical protein